MRFAEAGVDAIAIDYFGRTAGAERRGDEFEYMPHVPQTTWDGLQTDIRVAAGRCSATAGSRSLFTVGFCFGGRVAFLSLTIGLPELQGGDRLLRLADRPSRNDTPAPAEVAGQMRVRCWASSAAPTRGSRRRSSRSSGARWRPPAWTTRSSVPGAPHSFFDRKAEEFADASADAWERVLGFVRSRVGRPSVLSLR